MPSSTACTPIWSRPGLAERVRELGPIDPVPLEPTAPLDYVRLVDEEHEHRRGRRRGGQR